MLRSGSALGNRYEQANSKNAVPSDRAQETYEADTDHKERP